MRVPVLRRGPGVISAPARHGPGGPSSLQNWQGRAAPGLEGSIPSPRRTVALSDEPAIGRADVRSVPSRAGAPSEFSGGKARGSVAARFMGDSVALEMSVPAAEQDLPPRSLRAGGSHHALVDHAPRVHGRLVVASLQVRERGRRRRVAVGRLQLAPEPVSSGRRPARIRRLARTPGQAPRCALVAKLRCVRPRLTRPPLSSVR